MYSQTFKNVHSCILFQLFIGLLLLQINSSSPINSTLSYSEFLKEIKRDSCKFPSLIKLPLPSDGTFEYFETILTVCKAPATLMRSKEALRICSEIYSILKNITCYNKENAQTPEINIELSKDVCKDLSALQFPTSVEDTSLLKHMTDKYICDMMCDAEFQSACQVLLWSFLIEEQMKKIPSLKKTDTISETANNVDGEVAPENSVKVPNAIDKTSLPTQVPSNSEKSVQPDKISAEAIKDTENKENDKQILTNTGILKKGDKESKSNSPHEKEATLAENEKPKQVLSEKSDFGEKSNIEVNNNLNKTSDVVETAALDNVPRNDNENEVAVDTPSEKNNKVGNEVEKVLSKVPLPEKPSVDLAIQNEIGKGVETNEKSGKNTLKPTIMIQPQVAEKKVPNENKQDIVPKNDTQKLPISDHESNDKKTHKEKTVSVSVAQNIPPADNGVAKPEVVENNQIKSSNTKEPFTTSENLVESPLPITTKPDLEKMEEENEVADPGMKDQEHFNDMESEGDYSKLDYEDDEDGFYDPSKIEKTQNDAKKLPEPVIDTQNEVPKYDQPKNLVSHEQDVLPNFPVFPDQEDSHFFFYFLSIVLILMAGYLIFHNKQKIIALIVEGRHERRRRSPGVGYKKLETK